MTSTKQQQKTWEIYTASWKADSKSEKLELYKKSLSEDCCYTDPTIQTQGWSELATNMLAFHKQVPGGHFVTTYFLAHHDKCIARWEMRNVANESIGEGMSYGEYDGAGKLRAMTGFFDTP